MIYLKNKDIEKVLNSINLNCQVECMSPLEWKGELGRAASRVGIDISNVEHLVINYIQKGECSFLTYCEFTNCVRFI